MVNRSTLERIGLVTVNLKQLLNGIDHLFLFFPVERTKIGSSLEHHISKHEPKPWFPWDRSYSPL